jgi:ferredoxin
VNFINGQAHIQEDRCVRCGKCMEVCPFHAIIHIPVPCEDACPVGAVKKNDAGFVEIDHKSASVAAVRHELPRLGHRGTLRDLPGAEDAEERQAGDAMIAPAIEGQFPGTFRRSNKRLLQVGFSKVGRCPAVRRPRQHEAKELSKRKAEGLGWMTILLSRLP